jgi:hypothetical protein
METERFIGDLNKIFLITLFAEDKSVASLMELMLLFTLISKINMEEINLEEH